jgi:hypothetical protein
MKKSDDATMDAAFAAFWIDAERRAGAAAYGSLRQAFKRLLRAHDHYWGKGHVHRFEADIGKTTCGRTLAA